jgi:membrane protein implicated in regulation of membrane protease activity
MDILWWHWLLLGLVLTVAEMASAGGFYIIFFGLGAIVVGALAGLGVAGPVWMQLLLFAVLSITGLILFRGRVLRTFQPVAQAPSIDQLVGEVAVAVDDFGPGAVGRVELRGTGWSARVVGGGAVARGTRCRVRKVDGLMLFVEPEGAH